MIMLVWTKISRWLHKYLGLFGLLFFILLAVSGVLLMHAETLQLKDKMISQKYVPDKYFEIQQKIILEVRTIHILPNDSSAILVGTNRGIFKSTDGGKSWFEGNQGLYNLDISVIESDPIDNQVLYAGAKKGIFKSINGGESWDEWFEETSGLEHTDITDLAIDPSNGQRIFAATQNEIFLSEDGGETWEEIFEKIPVKSGGLISSVHIISENPSNIFAGTESGLFKTTDGGLNWARFSEEQLNHPVLSISSSMSSPHIILVATSSGLFRLSDNGKNLDVYLPDKSVRFITNNPWQENEFIMASGNKLYKSMNNGETWGKIFQSPDKEMKINAINFLGPSKGKILIGANKGFFSIDSENNLEHYSLNAAKEEQNKDEKKMNLLKLVTEIHTGRLFGNYFYVIFDIASVALIIISITGVCIYYIRTKIWLERKKNIEELDKVDLILDFEEKTQEITKDSLSLHELAEHIKKHILVCKSLLKNRNIDEINKLEAHVNSIDKKLHHLLNHVKKGNYN